jgi:hypothetical protein
MRLVVHKRHAVLIAQGAGDNVYLAAVVKHQLPRKLPGMHLPAAEVRKPGVNDHADSHERSTD